MGLMDKFSYLEVGKVGMPPLFDLLNVNAVEQRRMRRLGYLILVLLLGSQVSLGQSR